MFCYYFFVFLSSFFEFSKASREKRHVHYSNYLMLMMMMAELRVCSEKKKSDMKLWITLSSPDRLLMASPFCQSSLTQKPTLLFWLAWIYSWNLWFDEHLENISPDEIINVFFWIDSRANQKRAKCVLG